MFLLWSINSRRPKPCSLITQKNIDETKVSQNSFVPYKLKRKPLTCANLNGVKPMIFRGPKTCLLTKINQIGRIIPSQNGFYSKNRKKGKKKLLSWASLKYVLLQFQEEYTVRWSLVAPNSTVWWYNTTLMGSWYPKMILFWMKTNNKDGTLTWASLKMFFFRSMIFRRPPGNQLPTSPVWNQPSESRTSSVCSLFL